MSGELSAPTGVIPPVESRAGFFGFDAVWCICSVGGDENRLRQRWRSMGLRRPVTIVPALSTPDEPRIGVLTMHRRLIEAASEMEIETFLVFDDQGLWHEQAAALVGDALDELARQDWDVCILGGHASLPLPLLPTCRALARAAYVIGPHAVAYHRRCFARLLEDWPAEIALVAEHVKTKGGLDAYIAAQGRAFAVLPPASCLPGMLPFQPPALQHSYAA